MSQKPEDFMEGAAVPPALLDEILASRAKIEALDEAGRERFAQELGRRHKTPHVSGPFLLHVLEKNPPASPA